MLNKLRNYLALHRPISAKTARALSNKLAKTETELDQTKSKLTQKKSELTKAKSELTKTKLEITETKSKLSETKLKLENTKNDLKNFRNSYSELKHEFDTLKTSSFSELAQWTDIAHVEKNGIEFFVYTRDERIGLDVFKTGNYADKNLLKALTIIESFSCDVRNGIFVDIGANIGTVAISAIIIAGFSKVIAIEPEPGNYKLLQLNCVANNLTDQIDLFNIALSDSDEELFFELSPTNYGDHRVSAINTENISLESNRELIKVPGTTMVNLFTEHKINPDDVSLIWIDTQGYEGHILKGARNLLSHKIPLCLEFWPHGLNRTGGLELLTNILKENYSHFCNVRQKTQQPEMIDIENIADFANSFEERKFTDIIAVNLR